ncbi:hypothetical protein CEUSTIGMA_g11532.t1 [Chlamydomonas eustigma]|uniref:sphinganine-1-phosphate aldolase n=1 Tax=Chlamydomonas eustigma TaxID=1157962 RepID=A0A250XMG3_9CHLO|nr:hypothetical protein CEUSTIGMA_g11532.t1 [Chlamydomonas eustigma]|eukprot:GAX84109.1 hypothetical protein CEUSTIGMA_g11532.t1 [Chlamydomonas eustigma]
MGKLLELLDPKPALTWMQSHVPEDSVKGLQNYFSRFIGPICIKEYEKYSEALLKGSVMAQRAVNEMLHGFEPWEIFLVSIAACLILLLAQRYISSTIHNINEDGGFLPALFSSIRSLPFVQSAVKKEKNKLRTSLLEARSAATHKAQSTEDVCLLSFHKLPSCGLPAAEVSDLLHKKAKEDLQLCEGKSPLSGAVYIGSDAHRQLLDSAYNLFSLSNPLHADIWPSVRQMEAEVVAMTSAMVGGGPDGPAPDVCGAMTSGGTESILMAIKASRDYMRATRGVRRPEMILANSAHAAYWKACEYFKIKAVVVKVGSDYRLSARQVKRHVTSNTAIVVASAPGFPHGLVDDIQGIAQVVKRAGVCLHVDACLGGFVLPFAMQLGYQIPPFDFSVPGVTSMSVDTHKFGMAHKGTSVVLYADREIRQHQFTGITDWTGGLYISPGLAGSRPGALIATAWASLVKCGMSGYLEATRQLMEAATSFCQGVETRIPHLQVVGKPDMCVVAFKAKNPKILNIYKLNDLMTKRGWHLNALQAPPALHFCFTAAHNLQLVEALVKDLAEVSEELVSNPEVAKNMSGGSAPMYGMANVVPDRRMVAELLVAYQDAMLEP